MTFSNSLSHEEAMALGQMKQRRNNLVVFMGRNVGQLHDNVKYLFLHAANHDFGFQPYFFTINSETLTLLQKEGYPTATDNQEGIRLLTTAGMVVMDDLPISWPKLFMFVLGAKKLQLWHALALKKVGIPEIESSVNMTSEKAEILRFGYSACDTVLSTSPWATREHFAKAFDAERYIELGYPRNDVLLRPPTPSEMLNVDVGIYAALKKHKESGGKVVIYMPTFRDNGLDFLTPDGKFALDPPALAAYLSEHNIKMLLKLHPYVQDSRLAALPGVMRYANSMDIYPLLPLADILLTDYSSVSLDFLLVDKPIIYFPYDRERYISTDRELWFDYETLPGPIVNTQGEFTQKITASLEEGEDSHKGSRRVWRDKVFLYQDSDASERICRFIRQDLAC